MSTATLSTVEKAFRVLELFRERPQLGVSECARQLGIPRPSAHRMLATLHHTGALERSSDGKYQLGLRLFEFGTFAPYRRHLYDCACFPLESVVDATGLPAHLAVLDDDQALVLVKAHRAPHDRSKTRAGTREPLHASALGKVLLASADAALLRRVIERGLERFTPRTITDGRHLSREIAAVRARGVGVSNEEYRPGLTCLAMAVRQHGNVIAAVSIAAPSEHYGRNSQELERVMRRAVVVIEKNIRRHPQDAGTVPASA